MKNVTIDRTTTYFFAAFILLFMLLGLKIADQYLTLFIGTLLAFLILMLMLIIKHKGINPIYVKLFSPFALFLSVYVFNYSGAMHWIFYQVIFGFICFIAASIVWKKNHVKTFSALSFLTVPFLLYFAFIDKEALNPNTLGGYAFLLSFFPLLYFSYYAKNFQTTRRLFIAIILLGLIFFTETRSVILSIAFIFLTYFLWNRIINSKLKFKLYFGFIAAFCFTFTVIYPKLDKYLPNYDYLNYQMIKYTGKSIHSGRDFIWSNLIDVINQKTLLGYGSGALPSDFFDSTLSAHNLYLQITLQVGLVGMALFVIFLYSIWKRFWLNRFDQKVRFSAAFFIGIIIYQLSEVSLTQNNFSFALIQWLIIGVGLSYCLNKPKEEGKTAL
ncbi:O-antigen ligase [Lederbergia galactosidilyticus]|uniref:O-antigen ligase family protein n=1 Tax=Lederbergia galactosidilytica TaxID=217031 RepID=UPI001AE69520|nr:O-antigen ligase family protein [Lederbergia galactosidilytica]MBP1917178.1 O-antigen ligase [Lederbergia galactosidilytica]